VQKPDRQGCNSERDRITLAYARAFAKIMDVRKVAKLAHLEITDEEVALYTPQMSDIVKYVEQLNELDTEDIEPMLGGLTEEGEQTYTIREDESRSSFSQSEALREAPSAVSGHFQVPKVL
jgi:aspartyl-tRNA(Asn)/glutamyl-tRNA(Gln) amidotransferase subunit C